jgi:hypothetical protein
MVLDHVANDARLIIESPSPLYTEVFGHSNLNAFDMVSVPEWFHEGVRKPEHHYIVDGSLTEIMVNTKDR